MFNTKLYHKKENFYRNKIFFLGKFHDLEIEEAYLDSNILFLLTKTNKIFAINVEIFDIRKNLKNDLKIDKIQDDSLLQINFNSFERVYEIDLFNGDKTIKPSSIHINKLRSSLLIVYLKINPNNLSELKFCEISISEIHKILNLIKKFASVLYINSISKRIHIAEIEINKFIQKNNIIFSNLDNGKLNFNQNPINKYFNFLEKKHIFSSKSSKKNSFSLEELNLVSFLKLPILNDCFNKEIFENFCDLDIENLIFLDIFDSALTKFDKIKDNEKNQFEKFNINNNHVDYSKEKFIDFFNDKYFKILNLFKPNFTFLLNDEVYLAPSFIEIDELNGVLITRNQNFQFKLWDARNYVKLMEVCDRRIQEIRMANEIFIALRYDDLYTDNLFFEIYEIKTGKLLLTFKIDFINPEEQLEIIEFVKTKMLIKLSNQKPKLINLISGEHINIINEDIDFGPESMFIYVDDILKFICINKNEIIFINLDGKIEKKIKNENVTSITNENICISKNKKYFVIYWEKKFPPKFNKNLYKNYLRQKTNIIEYLERQEFLQVYNNKITKEKTLYKSGNSNFKNVDNEKDLNYDHQSFFNSLNNSENKIYKNNYKSINNDKSKNIAHCFKSKSNSHDRAYLDISNVYNSNSKQDKSKNSIIEANTISKINRLCDAKIIDIDYVNDSLSNYREKDSFEQKFSECENDSVLRNLDFDLNILLKSNKEKLFGSSPRCNKINNFTINQDINSSRDFNAIDINSYFNKESNFLDIPIFYENKNEDKNYRDLENLNCKINNSHKEIHGLNIFNQINIELPKFQSKMKLNFSGEIQIISMKNGNIDDEYLIISEENINEFENVFYSSSKFFNTKFYEIDINLIHFDEITSFLYIFGKKGEIIKILV